MTSRRVFVIKDSLTGQFYDCSHRIEKNTVDQSFESAMVFQDLKQVCAAFANIRKSYNQSMVVMTEGIKAAIVGDNPAILNHYAQRLVELKKRRVLGKDYGMVVVAIELSNGESSLIEIDKRQHYSPRAET